MYNDKNFNIKASYERYNKAIQCIFAYSILGGFGKNKKWILKNITIKHYIFERFRSEERIEINFK